MLSNLAEVMVSILGHYCPYVILYIGVGARSYHIKLNKIPKYFQAVNLPSNYVL